jgi:ribosome-associated protein
MKEEVQTSEPEEIEAFGIEVSVQPIELYKVLKIADLASGGGEAKHYISNGYIAVNGEVEYRKRRKLYDGDYFEFNQEFYVVVYSQERIDKLELENNSLVDVKNSEESVDKKQSEKSIHGRASIDFF